jgi:23S rRNA pseudouridine1911/1915/1917 synthase
MPSKPPELPDLTPVPEPGAQQSFLVFHNHAGQRVDKLLATLPGVLSRRIALQLIEAGEALLDGQPTPPDRKLKEGDVITYRVPAPQPSAARPEPAPAESPLEVLYEDADLIVINKPAGLSMHPGPGHAGGTLVNLLLAHAQAQSQSLSGIGGDLRPGVVHRLDKDTSGIVVVAKTDAAHVALAAQFKEHSTHRVYRALVFGRPETNRGTIEAPLARHPQHRLKRAVVSRGGKAAVTHWAVERRLGALTLLRLQLETGRTHQIRVHLAHSGWPVVGDPLYGNANRAKTLPLPEPAKSLLIAFKRQALHAAELGFDHPSTGEHLEFKTDLPTDMWELIHALATAQAEAKRDLPESTHRDR